MYTGSCLCGAVRINVDATLDPPIACHCNICRKMTGHYLVTTDIPRESLSVEGMEFVTWFHSSEKARRGFCAKCGSTLFFDPVTEIDWTSVAMGAFCQPTDVKTHVHIFVSQKGDYYEITDGLPQSERQDT